MTSRPLRPSRQPAGPPWHSVTMVRRNQILWPVKKIILVLFVKNFIGPGIVSQVITRCSRKEELG